MAALPTVPEPNCVYAVKAATDTDCQIVVTDRGGLPIPLNTARYTWTCTKHRAPSRGQNGRGRIGQGHLHRWAAMVVDPADEGPRAPSDTAGAVVAVVGIAMAEFPAAAC